jgi:ATP-dependent DNA ligase
VALRKRGRRRHRLRAIRWQNAGSPFYDDGPALFAAVVEAALEGIVAKRLDQPYRRGERGWVKIKSRDYWRFGQERELAQSRPRRRLTI